MALGATGASVIQLVVSEGVRVVLLGVMTGVGLALVLGRVVESMLYRTSPHDPAVLAVVSITLLLVAALACLVPAWRALRVDPASALRAE
jgi:putative ABC transport system permease protein